jgi:hypothetical protein
LAKGAYRRVRRHTGRKSVVNQNYSSIGHVWEWAVAAKETQATRQLGALLLNDPLNLSIGDAQRSNCLLV